MLPLSHRLRLALVVAALLAGLWLEHAGTPRSGATPELPLIPAAHHQGGELPRPVGL